MITKEIQEKLFNAQDIKYRDFQSLLIPTIDKSAIIGVRTPYLKTYAKDLKERKDIVLFLDNLPHKYFDENQLHSFIISDIKDYSFCLERVNAFLPYIDNWATTDQLVPKVFKKNKKDLLKHIDMWLTSEKTYTVRFGIKMLMTYFLDDDFDISFLDKVCAVQSDEYYVNMMSAWFFATSLAKKYNETLSFLEQKKLSVQVHNKAVQKALESRRLGDEQKDYLRKLKV